MLIGQSSWNSNAALAFVYYKYAKKNDADGSALNDWPMRPINLSLSQTKKGYMQNIGQKLGH